MDNVDSELSSFAFECIEAEWNQHDELLRLFIDNEGKGVDMGDCALVNKQLQEYCCIEGRDPGSYALEISSPGVERPLRRLKHFRQNLGKEVAIRFTEKIEGNKEIVGELLEVNGDSNLVLRTSEGGTLLVPISQVHKANIVFKWDA